MQESRTTNDDDLIKKFVFGALVAVPMIVWLVYVIHAGLVEHSADEPPELIDELRLAGVASGTALATIAGSFLGLQNQQNLGLLGGIRVPRLSASGWATLVYFSGLLIAVAFWALDNDRAYAAELITTSLASLVGFGIGALRAATTEV